MQRICYLNLLWSRSLGLYNKFWHQAEALSRIECSGISVSPVAVIPKNHIRYFSKVPAAKLISIDLSIPYAVQPFFYPFIVWPKLEEALFSYHAIIMRWTVPTKGLYRLSRSTPVFTEHHSKEVEELTFKRDPNSLAQLLFERYYGRKVLKSAKGILGVTNEIREYELKRAGIRKPSLVFPNGISVDHIPLTTPKRFTGESLRILFVGSKLTSWHGLDRLAKGMKAWRSEFPKIELWIVGKMEKDFEGAIMQDERIRYLGLLEGRKLDQVFSECHIAAGSLAVGRKGLSEACPLKVREYIARGIPFIYGYDDPDLRDNVPWCLKVPSREDPIEMGEVVEFAEKMSSLPSVSFAMRKFAKERLDWSKKMLDMLEFVRSNI